MLRLSHLALLLCVSLAGISTEAAAAERIAVGRFDGGTLNLYEDRFRQSYGDGWSIEELSVQDTGGTYELVRKGRRPDGSCTKERVALADASGSKLSSGSTVPNNAEAFVFSDFEVIKLDCLDTGVCAELIGGVTPAGRLIVDAKCMEVGPNEVCRCRVTFANGDTAIAPPPASGIPRCTKFTVIDWIDFHDWFSLTSTVPSAPL